jgi:hypothetical protein
MMLLTQMSYVRASTLAHSRHSRCSVCRYRLACTCPTDLEQICVLITQDVLPIRYRFDINVNDPFAQGKNSIKVTDNIYQISNSTHSEMRGENPENQMIDRLTRRSRGLGTGDLSPSLLRSRFFRPRKGFGTDGRCFPCLWSQLHRRCDAC